ncbi:PadR family transcriptional regulator [Halorubrum pallidum]|uniref:PadR family transcriptional regulator n=1 Tax=Halorubrum pallidum TaxID=1526114 RepID=A0ABD5SZI6_9EURY
MTKWLHSGRRRDLCALLYDAGELRAQSLKRRLESHYDEHIDPGSFYGTLTSLVEAGFLDRRTEGIADVYALTDAGERAFLDHCEWLAARVDGGRSADIDGSNLKG